jgi:hypothetical protein
VYYSNTSILGSNPTRVMEVRLRSMCLFCHVYSQNMEGKVPVFIFHRNRLAQLYTQALGSPFVVSYDSQGYGGGIRTRLHKEWNYLPSFITILHGPKRKHRSQQFLYCCLRIRCQKNLFAEPLPSNLRLFWLHCSGLQAPRHNIKINLKEIA